MGNKVTSKEIKIALHNYHSRGSDFFITECKNGSTYIPPAQGLLIFDGLAITKSYARPCIKGYEIKVSRGDFLQDGKWHLYLQYCNEFYFVVPKGLIKKPELPENVGLMYYDQEKGTIRKVKKALYRQIEEPVELYKYIIYSRMDTERIPFYSDKAEYAKSFIQDKANKRMIGEKLGSKISKELANAYKQLERLKNVEKELEDWEKVSEILEKHHIWTWRDRDDWIPDLEKLLEGNSSVGLDSVYSDLKRVIKKIERINNSKKEAE